MDDKIRSNDIETEDNPPKPSRKRRTPSVDRSDRNEKGRRRTSRSVDSKSKSRSRSRGRGRRKSTSRPRNYSPDRNFRRFGRSGFQRGFGYGNNRRQNRHSPSPPYRGSRRSRSSSYDRYKNRRKHSSSRSMSNERKAIQPPPPPSMEPTLYPNPNFQPEYQPNAINNMGTAGFQPYPNTYDYQMMQQANYGPFAQPPPPIIPQQDYQNWQQHSLQIPPPPIISRPPEPIKPANEEEEKQKRAAVELEKKNQRDTIIKQRDEYKRRSIALKRELTILHDQRVELKSGNEPPSPTTNGFLKENDRLQSEIVKKISTMENVIDMLNGIINNDKSTEEPHEAKANNDKIATDATSDDDSPERLKNKVIESLSRKRKDSERSAALRVDEKPKAQSVNVNLTFYDPEMHWCKTCSIFPKTAKEYLEHLHTPEHKKNVKTAETPWHEHIVNDDFPTDPKAQKKRVPIRGIQFFVPATAWYCQICSFWMGDLRSASTHLKSQTHSREFDKFLKQNPRFEGDWLAERERAYEEQRANERSAMIAQPPAVPPPPIIAHQVHQPPMAPLLNSNRVFDSIPLQLNQRTKEVSVSEEVEKPQKKGKKKKKEKKKRKKSKKKRSSSSSSSSSSDESSESEVSNERKAPPEPQPVIDTSTSIRAAMRRAHIKPKSDDEESNAVGGWTVVQEPKVPVAPQAPTISANGEAQNRRDDLIISQWNAPEPVISEREKQLFEQLKGKLKSREEKKKEKSPPPPPPPASIPKRDDIAMNSSNRSASADKFPAARNRGEEDRINKRDDDKRDRYDRDRDRDRRRRDRSLSRDRRDRRSRSHSPRRNRRISRSPRRRRSRSRSPVRDRRDKNKVDEFRPRVSDRDRDSKNRDYDQKNRKFGSDDKSNAKKSTSISNTAKKLPFIGRMPVFKKQSTEEEAKKMELSASEQNDEEQQLKKKRQDELKFQVQQKQQLLHQQQKVAEAYNLAHPGQFASVYSQHGSIHHVLPAPDYEDLMPDPMQFVSIMGVPPPPPTASTATFEDANEPVLPPGIDEEEAQNLETIAPAPNPDKDNLPKDFQDALSIIFDKGAAKAKEEADAAAAAAIAAANPSETEASLAPQVAHDETSISTFMPMELASMDSQHSQLEFEPTALAAAASVDLAEQSQYLYGSMADKPLNFNEIPAVNVPTTAHSTDLSALNIPTPAAYDGAGSMAQVPGSGSVLEVGNDYAMLNADANQINYAANAGANGDIAVSEVPDKTDEIELQNKRRQELDDLAMLGIDAEDLAAQCI